MPTTASAMQQAEVTASQSLTFVRNLLRVGVSQVLDVRGCFDSACFERKAFGRTSVAILAPKAAEDGADGPAKRVCGWLEHGVFRALADGFLERALLVIFSDEDAKDVIEAWAFSVEWTSDANGNAQPSLTFGGGGGGKQASKRKQLHVRLKPQYTMKDVSDASASLIRELTFISQTLPRLPERHWLSMKLLYREGVTPDDYEPEGFQRDADASLRFTSSPLRLSVPGFCSTAHHSVSIAVLGARDALGDDEGAVALATARRAKRGFSCDLDEKAPAGAPLDDGGVDPLLPPARDAVQAMAHDEPLAAADLAERLGTSTKLAARVLEVLTEERRVTPFQPDRQAHLVLHRKRARRADRSDCLSEGGATQDSSGAEEDHLSHDSASSPSQGGGRAPVSRAAATPRTAAPPPPATPAPRPGVATRKASKTSAAVPSSSATPAATTRSGLLAGPAC